MKTSRQPPENAKNKCSGLFKTTQTPENKGFTEIRTQNRTKKPKYAPKKAVFVLIYDKSAHRFYGVRFCYFYKCFVF